MKFKTSKSLQDFFNYIVATGLARLLPFFLLPYAAKILTPQEFGFFSLYRLYIAIGTVILLFGVEQALFRLLPEFSEPERLKALRAALQFVAGVILIALLVSWPWYGFLNRVLFTATLPFPFWLLFILILVNGLTTVLLTAFSAQQLSKKYLISNVWLQISFFFLFLFGLWEGWQLKAFFVAFIISNLLLLLINAKLLKSLITVRFEWSVLQNLVRTGFPLMLILLITYLLYQSDHYLIKFYLGVAQTGIYNYGYRFASIILIFVLQTNNVWLPRLYERGDAFFRKHFSAYAALIAISCAAILWILILFFEYFPRIALPAGFALSKNVLLIVGIGYVLYGQAQMMDGYLILKHKSKILVWISLAGLVLNIVLNLLFIPRFGLLAAAIITTLSFLLIWILILFYLASVIPKKELILTTVKIFILLMPFILLFFNISTFGLFLVFSGLALYVFLTNPLLKLIFMVNQSL